MYRYEHCEVTRVVDGDTFDIRFDLGFNITVDWRTRLRGFDCAETWRPSCFGENRFGEKATEFVRSILYNREIVIETKKIGIYNRYIVDVYHPDPDDPESGSVYSLKETLKKKKLHKRDLDCRKCVQFDSCDIKEAIYKKLKLRWKD